MRICPWWLGPLLASPIRRLRQNPRRLLAPCVQPGMTVLEPGPGMGFRGQVVQPAVSGLVTY